MALCCFLRHNEFQSTLPARGATVHAVLLVALVPISIHAPRTGSDAERWPLLSGLQYFNPRSPHGERPVRVGGNSQTCYFNPRSPHGERLGVTTTQEMLESISIHAPRTGSDRAAGTKRGTSRQFQSTLPARGATHAQKAVVLTLPISIHAPRTGSDTVLAPSRTQSNDFNPRSPHGERPWERWTWD